MFLVSLCHLDQCGSPYNQLIVRDISDHDKSETDPEDLPGVTVIIERIERQTDLYRSIDSMNSTQGGPRILKLTRGR
jgi:hypothetical protein